MINTSEEPAIGCDEDGDFLCEDHLFEAACEEPEDDGPACRVCGCTENNACFGGCWWVEPDLCSECEEVGGD